MGVSNRELAAQRFPFSRHRISAVLGCLFVTTWFFLNRFDVWHYTGADVVFVSTLGGAAFGDEGDISRTAFRTRAVDNYGYDDGDPTKAYWKMSQAVWFDDVVVATEYIGPQNSST